jgi:SSS family solute:Na+ symporter
VHTITEIPFLINMGWSFVITIIAMILISLAGPKVNPKAFAIDVTMFKVDNRTLVLIVMTLLLLTALYVRFW